MSGEIKKGDTILVRGVKKLVKKLTFWKSGDNEFISTVHTDDGGVHYTGELEKPKK